MISIAKLFRPSSYTLVKSLPMNISKSIKRIKRLLVKKKENKNL